MALESCAASDRKANESLILRLKTHARNLCLFWQAEWFGAAGGMRWTAGSASLLTATYGKICVELNCTAIRCA